MRRLALALVLSLLASPALAQYPAGAENQSSLALVAPTVASPTDSSNRIATTAWVNSLIANGLTLASGKIWIGSAGNIATPQTPSGDCTLSLSGVITCTQAAGNFQVIGNLTVGGSIIDGNGILATNIVAPATPAAGTTRIYVDSTTKTLSAKNDAGAVSNTVVASVAVANQFMTGISAAGVITRAQPAFSDLSGQGTCAQEPAMTGDVTSSAGSCALAIGANKVTRAMEAQGVARSVIGVAGNATANVADIQGSTANTFLGVNAAGTGLAFQSTRQILAYGTGGALPQASTYFIGPTGAQTTETLAQGICPISGSFRNLTILTGPIGGTAQTVTATMRTNTSDTALTCSISTGSTTCSDATHSATCTAGQPFSIKSVQSATTGSVSFINASVEFDNP